MTDPALAGNARRYRAYSSPAEVAALVQRNAGKLTPARVEALRQLACGLIDKIGSRLGFPRRTIATAQVLYHRFHLFFPLKDVAVQDVSVACLLVSSKLEDTLKKLRDIQIAAFQVRAAHEGLQQGALAEPDPAALEADRAKLIGVERLILETISFNFNLRSNAAYATRDATSSASQNQDTFAYVVKLGKAMRASKDFVKRAFRMAVDAHRTLVPLSYPPHTIAAACLFLTSFLTSSEDGDSGAPAFEDGWSERCRCDMEDIEDICHSILDLLLSINAASSSSLASSFASKPSPSETLLVTQSHSPREGGPAASSSAPSSTLGPSLSGAALSSELTQIKIRLRGDAEKRSREHSVQYSVRSNKRRRMDEQGHGRNAAGMAGLSNGSGNASAADERDQRYLGRDDVTIRFLWDVGDRGAEGG